MVRSRLKTYSHRVFTQPRPERALVAIKETVRLMVETDPAAPSSYYLIVNTYDFSLKLNFVAEGNVYHIVRKYNAVFIGGYGLRNKG